MEKGEKVKTKVRFTSLDVAAMVENLQALIGMRATNIYDLNPSTYLIKMAKSEQKSYLLIQNGVRFHTTSERPDKKALPSGFTMKFRKFLRSKRLESVRQVGVERVVVFTFGSQSFANHLIFELYAQGNIILTDNDYRILQCIRSHEFNQHVKTAVGQIYPFEFAANIYLENLIVNEEKIDAILEKEQGSNEKSQQVGKNKSKKSNKKGPVKVKDIVFKLLPCLFPLVIQHILISNNKNPEQKVGQENKQYIIDCGDICLNYLKTYLKSKHKGYLFYKEIETKDFKTREDSKKVDDSKKGEEPKTEEELKKGVQYFQFSSYKNAKYSNFPCKQFDTFDEAASEYYANYKKNQHNDEENVEGIAWKKYDQIKKDQDVRMLKLQQEQDIYKLKAEYIEKNIADVDAIIKIIKTMQDNGYSWDDISRMISESKKNGDPLANMIHQLNILKRQVTILLGDPISQQQIFELLPVEINIDYNAYTNATMYYDSKKKNFQKEQRTKQASNQVLKIAEKEALKKIQKKKDQIFSKNLPQRKTFWFEKFSWFITSEGYLVISGRDSHQNELLVKRYMKAADIYMHSDYGGAASTVIKSHRRDIAVPNNTLEEAAIFTVCRSKAWETKILSGAWWVHPQQVSKSAPTGEFLPTGSFMIRGKRNFIYPNRMEMGMTFLFKVDNQSAQRHLDDRRIHEEQVQKQIQDNKRLFTTTEHKQQDQFAIVTLDTQTRKQKMEEKIKLKLNQVKPPTQLQKQQQVQKLKEPSHQIDSDNQEQSEEQDKIQLNKKSSQTAKKSNQTDKKIKTSNKKQEQPLQPQQKHKQRNKKKLKRLEKYLQEQDEGERQLIMKMLGAKQMKHMKQDKDQVEKDTKKELNKNKKKREVKKGLSKYLKEESDDEQMKEKLNPDKVLFFKDKKIEKEQEKKLMQNSESSQDELQKQEAQNKEQATQEKQLEDNQNIEDQNEQEEDQQEQEEKQVNQQTNQKQTTEENKELQEEIDEKILDSELGELYKLVGNPHSEDKLEFFVPMCAPYNSIKQNRFKIKLVPGGLKKGKAARSILQYFNSFDLSEKEKIMLKALPEQDLINAVIGNVKLAGAGLMKMEMKEKQVKKMKRKEEDRKKEIKETQ